jgi:hypothetical protein
MNRFDLARCSFGSSGELILCNHASSLWLRAARIFKEGACYERI